MMQKQSQKEPTLNYSSNIIDIVQFGSSVIEGNKPNDIDIAVIFKNIPLKQQLEESQKIKEQLKSKFSIPIHITAYDFYSFFNEGNFAKEGILCYGKSLISRDYFSKKIGITPKIQISYSLTTLKKKDKVKFNYLLNGKLGEYGLLRKYKGKLVKPGLIEIQPEYERIFTEAIKKLISNFEILKILQF